MPSRASWGLVLVPLLAGLLPSHQGRHEAHNLRLGYKNPLDVTVDETGTRARLVLTGTPALAVVDLVSGTVKEETPWPDGKPLPTPSDTAAHVPDTWKLLAKKVNLPDAGNVRGVCEGPRKHLLFVHQRPKFNIPATQVAQGWVFTNAVTLAAVLPEQSKLGHHETFILDEPHCAYADPSAVVWSPATERAFVACAGADTVLVIDTNKLWNYLDKQRPQAARRFAGYPTPDSYLAKAVVDDLTTSRHYVIARLPTQANPRRLVLSGDGGE
jgi:DNA-binding beta-propeller fold protein YncE